MGKGKAASVGHGGRSRKLREQIFNYKYEEQETNWESSKYKKSQVSHHYHTFSRKAAYPHNLPQTVPTGEQVFKCWDPGGHFSFLSPLDINEEMLWVNFREDILNDFNECNSQFTVPGSRG